MTDEALSIDVTASLKDFNAQIEKMVGFFAGRMTAMEAQVARKSKAMDKALGDIPKTLQKNMETAAAQVVATTDKMEAAAKKAQRAAEKMGSQFTGGLTDGIKTFIAAAIGFEGASKIVEVADAWKNVGNQIASSGVAIGDVSRVREEILKVANDTRSSLESTASLYQKITLNAEKLKLNEEQRLRLTDVIQKNFTLSGTGTAAKEGALTQIGQGLSSVFQAEELNSIFDASVTLTKSLLHEFNVQSTKELKDLAAKGEVTGQRVSRAWLAAGEETDRQWDKTSVTVSQAIQKLSNNFQRFIGDLDSGTGAGNGFAAAIDAISNNIDLLAKAAGITVTAVMGMFAPRMLAGLGELGVAIWAATGPLGLVAGAVAGVVAAYVLYNKEINTFLHLRSDLNLAQDKQKQTEETLNSTIDRARELTVRAKDATGERKKAVLELRDALLMQAKAEAVAAREAAANALQAAKNETKNREISLGNVEALKKANPAPGGLSVPDDRYKKIRLDNLDDLEKAKQAEIEAQAVMDRIEARIKDVDSGKAVQPAAVPAASSGGSKTDKTFLKKVIEDAKTAKEKLADFAKEAKAAKSDIMATGKSSDEADAIINKAIAAESEKLLHTNRDAKRAARKEDSEAAREASQEAKERERQDNAEIDDANKIIKASLNKQEAYAAYVEKAQGYHDRIKSFGNDEATTQLIIAEAIKKKGDALFSVAQAVINEQASTTALYEAEKKHLEELRSDLEFLAAGRKAVAAGSPEEAGAKQAAQNIIDNELRKKRDSLFSEGKAAITAAQTPEEKYAAEEIRLRSLIPEMKAYGKTHTEIEQIVTANLKEEKEAIEENRLAQQAWLVDSFNTFQNAISGAKNFKEALGSIVRKIAEEVLPELIKMAAGMENAFSPGAKKQNSWLGLLQAGVQIAGMFAGSGGGFSTGSSFEGFGATGGGAAGIAGGGGGFDAGSVGNSFSSSAGGYSSFGSGSMSAYDMPKFADGGDPPVGRMSMVGERGPELFMPKQAGTILPADLTKTLLTNGLKHSTQPTQAQTPVIFNMPINASGAVEGTASMIAKEMDFALKHRVLPAIRDQQRRR